MFLLSMITVLIIVMDKLLEMLGCQTVMANLGYLCLTMNKCMNVWCEQSLNGLCEV